MATMSSQSLCPATEREAVGTSPFGRGCAREAVITEALTWQRTPFVYGQCVKGVAADCGRFIASCLNNSGAQKIDVASLPQLSPQWFLHRADGSFIDLIKRFAGEYRLSPEALYEMWGGPTKALPEPADIVVAKCGRDWAHSALVIEWPKVICASMGRSVAVWQDIYRSPQFGHRELRFFDPFQTTPPSAKAALVGDPGASTPPSAKVAFVGGPGTLPSEGLEEAYENLGAGINTPAGGEQSEHDNV